MAFPAHRSSILPRNAQAEHAEAHADNHQEGEPRAAAEAASRMDEDQRK